MKVTPTAIADVLVLEPKVFGDERGFFMESFNQNAFNDAVGREWRFVQDNHSRSAKGVLRGLHYQLPPHAQGKLVRVTQGAVFDVAVDIRPGSASFGCAVGVFQSLAWMTNKKAMVVGFDRARGRLCSDCDNACDNACPMRLKPRTIKRHMFTCTQCVQCVQACGQVQANNPHGSLLQWVDNACALDKSDRGFGHRPAVPGGCFDSGRDWKIRPINLVARAEISAGKTPG